MTRGSGPWPEPYEGFDDESQEAFDAMQGVRKTFLEAGLEGCDLIAGNGLTAAVEALLEASDAIAIYATQNDDIKCASGTVFAMEHCVGVLCSSMQMVGNEIFVTDEDDEEV